MLEMKYLTNEEVLEHLHPELIIEILDYVMFKKEHIARRSDKWRDLLQKYNVIRKTTKTTIVRLYSRHRNGPGIDKVISFANGNYAVVLEVTLSERKIARIAALALKKLKEE